MTIPITPRPRPVGRGRPGSKRSELREAISALRPGTEDSFDWPRNREVFAAARSIGARITTRKIDGGYRIWRIADREPVAV